MLKDVEMRNDHRYHLKNDVEADQQFQKLAELEKQENALKEQKQEYTRQISEWFERNLNEINRKRENAQALINEYRLTKPNGKVDTPSGQTVVRNFAKVKYDETTLTDYLKNSHPELLKYSVNKTELKKAVKNVDGRAVDENGEIVDGIKFEQTESVSYKLAK